MSGWLNIYIRPKDSNEKLHELVVYSRVNPMYELFHDNLNTNAPSHLNKEYYDYLVEQGCTPDPDIDYNSLPTRDECLLKCCRIDAEALSILKIAVTEELKSWKDYLFKLKKFPEEDGYTSIRETKKMIEEQTALLCNLNFIDRIIEENELYCYTT